MKTIIAVSIALVVSTVAAVAQENTCLDYFLIMQRGFEAAKPMLEYLGAVGSLNNANPDSTISTIVNTCGKHPELNLREVFAEAAQGRIFDHTPPTASEVANLHKLLDASKNANPAFTSDAIPRPPPGRLDEQCFAQATIAYANSPIAAQCNRSYECNKAARQQAIAKCTR